MSGAPNRKPPSAAPRAAFDVKDWVSRTTAFATANPHLAHRAYASAAARIRREAEGHPQGEAMRTLAAQLDGLGTKARTEQALGAVHVADYGEPVFGDPLEAEHHELGVEIAHMEAAMNAGPTIESDSLHEAIAQQEGAMELQRAIVQPVQINPASAQFGKTLFGNSAVVQFTNYTPTSGTFTPYVIASGQGAGAAKIVAQPEQNVISWQGYDNETTVCNVTVGRGVIGALAVPFVAGAIGGPPTTLPTTGSPFLSGAGVYRPYFHAFFGAGQGQPNELYGDVGRGAQFTVSCSRITVNVGMDAPPAGATSQSGFPGAMYLNASLGFFSSARRGVVTRTVYADNILTGISNETFFIIPVFADTIQNIIGLTPANTFSFTIFDVNGNVLGIVPPTGPFPFVLDDEAYAIGVVNTGGSTNSCRIVFGLAI